MQGRDSFGISFLDAFTYLVCLLTSRDLPTSPPFVASSEVEMECVGAGSYELISKFSVLLRALLFHLLSYSKLPFNQLIF